jgi:hypothetical protein
MDKKVDEIINAIIKGTDDGTLKWSQSAFNDQYKLDFKGGSIVIQKLENDEQFESFIVIEIKNINGDTIFRLNANDDFNTSPDNLKYFKLFRNVNDKVNMISETINKIYNELDLDLS